ncbi:MAG: (2Fe-2S)-binding protein [Halapricum sp.]
MQIELQLNGKQERFEAATSDSLLDVLRHNGYTGAKRGCDTGACGFCTVVVDGEAKNACVTPARTVDGTTVETIEGLGTQSDLHPIQEAFVDHSALQCGFCIPGMIMRSKAFLEENPDPTEQEVREGLSENLCRCTGYKKIVEAVLDAADRMDESGRRSVAADGGRAGRRDGSERADRLDKGEIDAEGCGCCEHGGES